MQKLLEFILKGLLPDKGFSIDKEESEGSLALTIKTKPENIGIIIGKGGKTIKAIRNLLRARATLEKKGIFLTVQETN